MRKVAVLLRFLPLVTLILLAPAASAGVSLSSDVLPDATYACADSYESSSDSWRGSDNESEYGGSWGRSERRNACASQSDTARANVSSNRHHVASARIGSSTESSESDKESYDAAYWRTWAGNSSYGGSWGSWSHESERASRAGDEVTVSTFAGSLTSFSGCAERDAHSHRHSGGYSSSEEWWSSDSNGESSYAYDATCERTLTAATGVTTVRAGQESPCAYRGRSTSWSYDSATEGSYFAMSSSESTGRMDCASEHFAQAGSERVAAGQRDTCTWQQYDQSFSSGNESYGQAWRRADCTSRYGLFGPDGFALYVADARMNEESCDGNGNCTSSESGSRYAGAEHDLVGTAYFPLP